MTDIENINTLEQKHWDACSLRCPSLSGGTCGSGRMTGCPGWSSKFPSAAAEIVYGWTLGTNQDDSCGNSSEWNWWAAVFKAERLIIQEEGCNGAVYLLSFDTDAELNEAWSSREDDYDDYVHAECADGRDCEGCVSCENA